jgi:hypothetical protein
LFNADQRFYDLWTEVTSTFGLVVNHDKTGRSDRFLELNSSTYDLFARRFVAKPVLSFLLRERDSKECLITQAIEGMRSFKNSVKEYVLNVLLRREISLRCIDIQTLPPKRLGRLIKRSWFRNALVRGPVPLRRRGVERTVEMVIDRPVRPRFYAVFDKMCRDVRTEYIERWKGVKVRPLREEFIRTGIRRWWDQEREPSEPLYRLRFGPRVWRFVWPRAVRDFCKSVGIFDRITLCDESLSAVWLEDHAALSAVSTHVFGVERRLYSQPSCLDYRKQYPLGYR